MTQWFSTYTQACIDLQLCQKALMLLKNNFANIRFQNLVTIGAKYMAVMDGKGIPAIDNLNVDTHPNWSQISILDVSSNGTTKFDEALWVDPKIWEMDQPKFTCSPPCNVKLPPWTGATSTVNYPLITVSQGTWTSTITQPPLTITEWVFEPVTVTQEAGNNNKRADVMTSIWPIPATTPFWPAVVYMGADGKATTTSATGTFPTPQASIGPNAPAPPTGSWPKRAVQAFYGFPENPLVEACDFLDFDAGCVTDPWLGNKPNWNIGGGGGDGDTENQAEMETMCPRQPKSSSSTSARATTTRQSIPTPPAPSPSPFEHGDARLNSLKCFKGGEMTENIRMQNATNRFCDSISHDDLKAGYFQFQQYDFEYNGGVGFVSIKVSLQIKDKCAFDYSKTLCQKYLSVPRDSCDCNGVDGKHGGIVENNCYVWRIDPNRHFCGEDDTSVVCQD